MHESALANKNVNKNIPELMVHGVFLSIFDKGVLLTGKSGSGKSDCALQLLDRNHCLIADDMCIFQKNENETLIGTCPPSLHQLLEIRGLGVVNVTSLFGIDAVLEKKTLDLIIHLTLPSTKDESFARRIHPKLESKIIMGVSLLHLTVSLAFTGNMAILIESAVKFAFTEQKSNQSKLGI